MMVPSCLALTGTSSAQAIVAPTLTPAMPAAGHGLPGKMAGTEQWNVTFVKRSFDLSAFRTAVYANRPWSEVEPIIAGYRARTQTDQAAFVEAIEQLGGQVYIQYWLINAAAIEIPFANIAKLRKLNNVLRIAPNLPAYPVIKIATSAANHNSDSVNLSGYKGKGIATAIVDTGLDGKNASNNRPHRTFYEDGNLSKRNRLLANIQVGLLSPENTHPHGTGVAGITAGGNWGTSQADHGHAPHADIVGYSLSNNSNGGTTLAIEAKAWQFVARDAVQYKIKTANNSYSGTSNALDVSQMALDSCALNADVMICVAAGNSGASTTSSQSVVNGLAVAAVNATAHTMATFSSRGPIARDTQRFYPDISGCGVSTIMPRSDNESTNYVASGTSMASPQVCGAATLLRGQVTSLTAIETKAILLVTALDISQKNLNAPYNTRNAYGMGLLRDDSAMKLARATLGHGSASVTTANPTWTTVGLVQKGKTYRAIATWMRQTMSSTAWSDLNVEILSGTTVIASSKTTRNLYEMPVFRATSTGAVTIKVTGKTIENGKQDFAWAFTEGSGPPLPSDYELFGVGCASTRTGCTTCTSRNWTQTLTNQTGSATRIGILETTQADSLTLCGIDLYMKARTGTVSVNVSIQEYDPRTAAPGKVLATAKVNVGAQGMYQATFPTALVITPFSVVIITFDNADKLVLPVSTTGTNQAHWEFSGATWGLPKFTTKWQYRMQCDKGSVVPQLTNTGQPVIGKSMTVDLDKAPGNVPAVFVIGISNTKWGTINLPWAYAAPCSVLASLDFLVPLTTTATGTASTTLAAPNQIDLVGIVFFNQYLISNPANAFGVIASNGGKGTIGEY